jgi:hypothetical protein
MNKQILEIPEVKNAGIMDRLKFAEEILESIGDLEITDCFRNELNMRFSQISKKPKLGRTWSMVKSGRRK